MYTVERSTMSFILRGHLNVANHLPLLWHHLPPGCHKPPLKCDCTWLQLLMALKRKGFLQRSQSEATSAWKIFLSRVSAAHSSAFHSAAAGVIHRFSSCTSGQQWWWWGAKSLDDRASRTLTLTAAPERCKPLSPIQQIPANPTQSNQNQSNLFTAICFRGWWDPVINIIICSRKKFGVVKFALVCLNVNLNFLCYSELCVLWHVLSVVR